MQIILTEEEYNKLRDNKNAEQIAEDLFTKYKKDFSDKIHSTFIRVVEARHFCDFNSFHEYFTKEVQELIKHY